MNKQRIHDILSSIQMSPRDKKDLVKDLSSNNCHIIEIFDFKNDRYKTFKEVYEERKNVPKNKFVIGSVFGELGNLYVGDDHYEYCAITSYGYEGYTTSVYANSYGDVNEFYRDIVLASTIIDLDNPDSFKESDSFPSYGLPEEKIAFRYQDTLYAPIASMFIDDGILYLINVIDKFITVALTYSHEIIIEEMDLPNTQNSLMLVEGREYDGLNSLIDNAIKNGISIYIGTATNYSIVESATQYSSDYGVQYLYTKTAKYRVDGNKIIKLSYWDYEKVVNITYFSNINYDDLLNYIKNNITILHFGSKLHVSISNTDNIICHYLFDDMVDEPFIAHCIITKNTSTGKCKVKSYYKTNELKTNIAYIADNTKIYPDYYNIIVPTKDITIQFNEYYSNQYADYFPLGDLSFKYKGCIEFTENIYNISFPDVLWSTDSILEFKPNHIYVFEIQQGLGIMKEYVIPTE